MKYLLVVILLAMLVASVYGFGYDQNVNIVGYFKSIANSMKKNEGIGRYQIVREDAYYITRLDTKTGQIKKIEVK